MGGATGSSDLHAMSTHCHQLVRQSKYHSTSVIATTIALTKNAVAPTVCILSALIRLDSDAHTKNSFCITGDSGMQVWNMSSTPGLMCTICAAVNRLDCVNSMCCDVNILAPFTGDGGMRVWKMSSTPGLMCTIRAAVNRLDCVNSMCCDAQHEHVIVGDTGGHVKVWRVDPKVRSSSGSEAAACFVQVY